MQQHKADMIHDSSPEYTQLIKNFKNGMSMKKILLFLITTWFCIIINGVENNNTKNKSANDNDTQNSEQVEELKPGEWAPLFDLGLCLFPSMIISTATINITTDNAEQMQERLGEWWGTIGVEICSPSNNCPIKIEISGNTFIKPSIFKTTLPKAKSVYLIYPPLKYEYEKLLQVGQTTPEDLTFKVTIDKNEAEEEIFRFQVRPINDCVYYYVNAEGEDLDVGYFFAAYVNENHPGIEKILQECLSSGKVDSFSGYSGTPQEVKSEIKAIWETLARKGIRYSSINTTSGEDEELSSQHVRLLGETLTNTQANCVDGSVMLASILRKIGLDVSLVLIPEHMLIYVNLDEEGKQHICIETTMLGTSSFEDAVEDGNQEYDENEKKFDSDADGDGDYQIVNIAFARRIGIMPIKEYSKSN